MPSSLFGGRSGNSILAAVNSIRAMGDPNAVYTHMYQNDPNFRQFADSVRGKTPEQAFRERGMDYSQVRQFMG